MKNQFTFYRSFWEVIEKLPTNKEKLQTFEILCQYGLEGKEPDLKAVKPTAAAIYCIAKPIMDTAPQRAEKLRNGNKVSPIP